MKKRSAPVLCSALLAVAIFAATLLCACAPSSVEPEWSDPEEAAFIVENARYVLHAAGRLGEEIGEPFDGSNSMEGLENAVRNGRRVVELDFNFTADGYLACIHDWYAQYSSAIENDVPLTLEEFLSCKIYDRYTPVWLGSLGDFLAAHEDVYIVTDVKDDNLAGVAAIAENLPEMKNRFIIQIYAEDEYDDVRALGFEYVIYTLYRLDWNSKTDTRALCRFAAAHPLIGYAFSYELCEEVDRYVENMKKAGVPLFVHTVNDPDEQRRYFAMGIDGVYTDIADIEDNAAPRD